LYGFEAELSQDLGQNAFPVLTIDLEALSFYLFFAK